ncbi:MAG: SH3 domain-containing protein [Balneolaceae bacterium]|nr:SH3 domain-containing protein [Balneolaceae bacterium]
MKRSFLFLICLFLTSACSSSRWVVTDQHSINTETEPVILNEEHILLLEDGPTVEDPVMSFGTYSVVEKQYEERVLVERTVQKYKPRWQFMLLGMTGAAFAMTAGNTNLILSSVSVGQQVAFNVAAAVLGGLSFTNMEPTGDPIYTGETRLQRRSGTEILSDTTQTNTFAEGMNISLDILYKEEVVFSESDIVIEEGSFDINLVSFLEYINSEVDAESSLEIELAYNGFESSYSIPVTDFLAPFVTITEPVAVIRNAPSVNELNVVTEIGNGSSLELIGEYSDQWYRVRFGGSEVFVSRSAGVIEWMSETGSGSPNVFEFAEVPFGEVDVENSVPVLKQNNPNDRAIILTNGFSEETEPRQYLGRDHDLFRFYMRYALQMDEDQISEIDIDSTENGMDQFSNISEMDSTGTLFVYLSGSAFIDELNNLYLNPEKFEDGESEPEYDIFNSFERINPSSVVLFADLEFITNGSTNGLNGSRDYQAALQNFSDNLLRRIPNSAVIFSHRPGQESSLFIGGDTQNKRHHIFSYYLAEALKQRNTQLSEIVRHLENNVDYTSRRLHDRPQEIQVFGNLTIDIAE